MEFANSRVSLSTSSCYGATALSWHQAPSRWYRVWKAFTHFISSLNCTCFFSHFLRLSSTSEETCSDMLECAGGKYFLWLQSACEKNAFFFMEMFLSRLLLSLLLLITCKQAESRGLSETALSDLYFQLPHAEESAAALCMPVWEGLTRCVWQFAYQTLWQKVGTAGESPGALLCREDFSSP